MNARLLSAFDAAAFSLRMGFYGAVSAVVIGALCVCLLAMAGKPVVL